MSFTWPDHFNWRWQWLNLGPSAGKVVAPPWSHSPSAKYRKKWQINWLSFLLWIIWNENVVSQILWFLCCPKIWWLDLGSHFLRPLCLVSIVAMVFFFLPELLHYWQLHDRQKCNRWTFPSLYLPAKKNFNCWVTVMKLIRSIISTCTQPPSKRQVKRPFHYYPLLKKTLLFSSTNELQLNIDIILNQNFHWSCNHMYLLIYQFLLKSVLLSKHIVKYSEV